MIVTRSWLNEFIELDDISNDRLYETFNAIGLEVDSFKSYEIPQKVVVGEIISCQKHPNADKLNVCQVDVGVATRQIVCGAANVVDAKYVAVALVGAVLPGDFEIKFATLRDVDSEGMICSSKELGLPESGDGIMILDDSIGELVVGHELSSYGMVADTLIELELTANRGDCLSVQGVARDLSVALDRDMRTFEYKDSNKEKLGIARVVDVVAKSDTQVDLCYALASIEQINVTFLVSLRLAMIGIQADTKISKVLEYVTHTTGIILRAYDADMIKVDEKIRIEVLTKKQGIVTTSSSDKLLSIVGVNQIEEFRADKESGLVLFESSYIHPDLLVEAVAKESYERDDLYYKTSRGSESALQYGMKYFSYIMKEKSLCECYDGYLNITAPYEPVSIAVDFEEICSLIGQKIESSKMVTILKKLGFDISSQRGDKAGVRVPRFRHDIKNIQDIAEEVVRIVGINNIDAKPLTFRESNRLNDTTSYYGFKKALRHRATATGLNENISYLFAQRSRLKSYGFETLPQKLDLTNPIAEELNTLRTTILTNLLEAVKRNVNYTEKSIGLFEIGAIFDKKRNQRDVLSVVFSGQDSLESVVNSGKPEMANFASFVKKLGYIIGDFELVESRYKNALIHPYQSADIIYRGVKCGYLSKLHPVVQEDYGIPDTFVAEIEMDALLPIHIDAQPISNYQGVYKDLSIVIDKAVPYSTVKEQIASLELESLKSYYPVDIYEDETLGDKKSLSIRFFIQSMNQTLQDEDIESVISQVMSKLEQKCQAVLR